MQYKRAPLKFLSTGIDLNHPPDLMPMGKFPFLKNVQSYQDGRMETRAPLTTINSAASSPDLLMVSSFRLNDYVTETFTRFLKINANLYFGTTSFTQIDTGYTAVLPLSAVAWRPDRSPQVWAYLADTFRMRKARSDGTNFQVGVAPPTIIPTMELDVPLYVAPAAFEAATSWGSDGTVCGGISLVARLTSVTIGTIKYNTGTTGFACIAPTGGNLSDITAGMRVIINSGGGTSESVVVEEIHKVFNSGSNTISQIIYDAGTSGLCTISPTQPLPGIDRNALLQLNGTEFVRVISVTNGDNGLSSFRCSTAGTFVATNTITTPASGNFFAYLANSHSAGETLTAHALQSTITAAATGAAGYINFNLGATGYNLGLVGNRPITPDDFLHIGINIDNPANISQIMLVLDVDPGTSGSYTSTDGTKNAYYVAISANDLQFIIGQKQTQQAALNAAIQNFLLQQTILPFTTNSTPTQPLGTGASATPVDQTAATPTTPANPINAQIPTQLALGNSQWTEVKIRIADLTRIGAALAVDLSNVRAIQLQVMAVGGCTLQFANLWVGGTYGPDTTLGDAPLIYRFRYRSSTTGAHSLPGPATRSGIQAFRQQVLLTGTASTDPQIDKIDWERMGAQNLTWNFIGTSDNSSPTFADDNMSAAIQPVAGLETDAFQPFPLSQLPQTTLAVVAGTAIKRISGAEFDPLWARGTEVFVNGKLTELYASPVSTELIHVADAMAPGASVSIFIPEPIKCAQPLPYMWGPYFNSMFACGNTLDVGSVYWTKGNDPDSAPDTNRLEVTSPSEVMVNGCVFDGRAYAWSDKRMFSIIPDFNDAATYNFVEVPNSRGLWAPYALAVGPKMWYLSSDGIYESDGGTCVCITDDIKLLFLQADVAGFQVNGMFPVQMSANGGGVGTQIHRLRLTYHNQMLIFDYVDCNGTSQALVYDLRLKGWFPYTYFEGASQNVIFHSSEQGFVANDAQMELVCGTDTGHLYSIGANGSGVEIINCEIDTPAMDVGDSRAKKLWGDIVFDMDAQGVNVVCTPWINNYQTVLTPKTYNGPTRTITDPIDLSSGVGQFARNLGVKITWSLNT